MSDLNQNQPKWKWVTWKGIIKMEAAEELKKPSPFGQEEKAWSALREELNENLKAIVQEVQAYHLNRGGKNLQTWTDDSWREFYTDKLDERLEGWKEILQEQADDSLKLLKYHPDLLLEPSIKIETLPHSRIKCVAAYCIGRDHVDDDNTRSKGHSLYCIVEFGFERKPVAGDTSQRQRSGFSGSAPSGQTRSGSADGSSAAQPESSTADDVALEPDTILGQFDDSHATQKSSMQ